MKDNENKVLTEAPLDTGDLTAKIDALVAAGILTQEEADVKKKALETKAAEVKAKEDADAKAKADAETKAKADKLAKEQEAAKEVLAKLGPNPDINKLFNELVPGNGTAETVAGELVRAMAKVQYRDYNDGDVFYEGYGLETCAPAAAFLMNFDGDEDYEEIEEGLKDIEDKSLSDSKYTAALDSIADSLTQYIMSHPALLTQHNEKDMLSSDISEIKENAPTYESYIDLPQSVIDYIEAGKINESDVQQFVEDCMDNDPSTTNSERDIRIGDYQVEIDNLDRDAYDWCEDRLYKELEDWGDSDLPEEYGSLDKDDDDPGEGGVTPTEESLESKKEEPDVKDPTKDIGADVVADVEAVFKKHNIPVHTQIMPNNKVAFYYDVLKTDDVSDMIITGDLQRYWKNGQLLINGSDDTPVVYIVNKNEPIKESGMTITPFTEEETEEYVKKIKDLLAQKKYPVDEIYAAGDSDKRDEIDVDFNEGTEGAVAKEASDYLNKNGYDCKVSNEANVLWLSCTPKQK